MEKTEKRLKSFRLHAFVLIFVLVAEFILGTYAALFVEFPESLVNGNAWSWAMSRSFIVGAHAVLGTVLALGALEILALGFAIRNRRASIASVAGFLMVALAWLGGAAFLSDVSKDVYSFLMAIGFIGALVSYGFAYHLAARSSEAGSRR
jgi:hypothetical protein